MIVRTVQGADYAPLATKESTMQQLTVTVFVQEGYVTETATQIDIALASISGMDDCAVNDWSIENEQGETFTFDSAETGGSWA